MIRARYPLIAHGAVIMLCDIVLVGCMLKII